jgi:hypothetical protein
MNSSEERTVHEVTLAGTMPPRRVAPCKSTTMMFFGAAMVFVYNRFLDRYDCRPIYGKSNGNFNV